MIDMHCHLLYGVDDGPGTMEEAVAMLKEAAKQGIHAIILTPHWRHGMFPYPKDAIEAHYEIVHKYAREEDRPEKTLFIITTDGMENASQRYTYDKVKRMVEHEKEKYGWEFLFLGANIDAAAEAERFGIKANRAVNYECDSRGTEINFQTLSKAVTAVRESDCYAAKALDDDWKADIEADYKKRHRK